MTTTPSAAAMEAAGKHLFGDWQNLDARAHREIALLAETLDAFAETRAAEAMPPEHPTPEMIAAGVRMHQTPRTGPPETLVHDIYQAMYEEWKSP